MASLHSYLKGGYRLGLVRKRTVEEREIKFRGDASSRTTKDLTHSSPLPTCLYQLNVIVSSLGGQDLVASFDA
jgi:hypothetical protein